VISFACERGSTRIPSSAVQPLFEDSLRAGPHDSVRRETAESTVPDSDSGAAPAAAPGGSASGTEWYEELRERYRPARLRYLLIAESPPDPGDGERRFFYSPALTIDNLYRGVAEAVYGQREDVDLQDKPAVLRVYAAIAPSLRNAGVPVLHDEALPFPLGNWRSRFVVGFRTALDD
jgi:hypothetical protein